MAAYVQGIDVSHYQGNIDWAGVLSDPASPQFVYMKATEGGTVTDPRYSVYRQAAKARGLLCGAYHFFVPTTPVGEQVDNFVAAVGSVAGELPPMLDIEQGGLAQSPYLDAITDWLRQVGERLQCTPGIYTGASFWNANVSKNAPFPSPLLWISHYTSAPAPALPPGADNYTFWQHSESGKINGIDCDVDLNRYCGTLEALRQLANG